MKRIATFLAVFGLLGSLSYLDLRTSSHTQAIAASAAEKSPMMLVHNVYFQLNESTPEARKKLVDSCDKFLSDHPGTVFYACGTVSDLDRPVNDRDWDVGLHLVFKDRAALDAYIVAPKHVEFVEQNKTTWKKVRVFDSDAPDRSKP